MLINILSLAPFFLIIYFLVVRGVKAFKVMPMAYFFTLLILAIFWQVDYEVLFSSTVVGILSSLEIFLIVISILLLYNLLDKEGKLDKLKNFLSTYSSDRNVQIIFIGWFLVSFFEAIAGFGTPAAVAAPLLVFLGFRPLVAVVVTLVADSVSVAFGAFGTPIVMGIDNAVSAANLAEITFLTSLLNGFVAIFMPFVLISLYHILEKKKLSQVVPYIPFSLGAGLAFAIPYVLVAYFIGPETPSVLASIIGFLIVLFMLRNGLLIEKSKEKIKDKWDILKSMVPYFFLIGLLVITRVNIEAIQNFLAKLEWEWVLYDSIGFEFSIDTPGILIFFTFLIFLIIYRIPLDDIKEVVYFSVKRVKFVLITLIFTLAFVELILNSDMNNVDYEGIPQTIGLMFADLGILYILFSPILGALGSFIAGSATVSNLIFAPIQESTAIGSSLSKELVLPLQSAGASAGNMIAIHNVLAVAALVNLKDESKVIRINMIVALLYCLAVALIGYLIHFFLL